jgi:isocitrate dehydrogenase (NAD+)
MGGRARVRDAENRSFRLAAVGDDSWFEVVDEVAASHEHVRVEHLAPRVAVPMAAFNASRFDVVAIAKPWAEAVTEIAAAPASSRVAAHGLLAEHGPSLFVPSPDGGAALAGHGVVNPSSMLLAAAMMLEHGLGAVHAGQTLAGAVSAALADGPQTPDLLQRGAGATTAEFTRRVVGTFQLATPNFEFRGAA